jgi:hypothetical protein
LPPGLSAHCSSALHGSTGGASRQYNG